MAKKQAVMIVHGMGEQIPMETLKSFVDTVWTYDSDLVGSGKPDPNTGGKRRYNASWSKPDPKNRSFELRVITTERGKSGKRTDFFEYYWAHRVEGTTREQLWSWISGLMWRNPFTRVPKKLLPAWGLLWVIAAIALAIGIWTLKPDADGEPSSWFLAVVWALASALSAILLNIMLKSFGDVARYVRAKPANVAIRQTVRENGVRLLEDLMGIDENGRRRESDYDRIVVVGHSLGTIVAYDILTHAFGRINKIHSPCLPGDLKQPKRNDMEAMIREALKPPSDDAGDDTDNTDSWLDRFREAQTEVRDELVATGSPWIVSDFLTIGSPLTHADILLVHDRSKLENAKERRVLPTCPPTLEYDGTTKIRHFTYRAPTVRHIGDSADPESPRVPHHAALFAYTRWSNIYSPHRWIFWGDIISGPLCHVFGLKRKPKQNDQGSASKSIARQNLCGIKDIQVMPTPDAGDTAATGEPGFLTHTKYWKRRPRSKTGQNSDREWPHIGKLRDALDLGRS